MKEKDVELVLAAYNLLYFFHERFIDKLILQFRFNRIWCRQKFLQSSLDVVFPPLEKQVICDICSLNYKLPIIPIVYKGEKYFNFYFKEEDLEDWKDLLIKCKSCKNYIMHQPIQIKDCLNKYVHKRYWNKNKPILTDKDIFIMRYFLGRSDYQNKFEKTCVLLCQRIFVYFTEDILVL
jgi:hypothetical protein